VNATGASPGDEARRKAIVAVAHSTLVIIWHLLDNRGSSAYARVAVTPQLVRAAGGVRSSFLC
jgi:hypothetical protein